MTTDAKFRGLLEAWKNDKTIIIVCWFDETFRNLSAFLTTATNESVPLFTPREVQSVFLQGKQIIFAEHYPLWQKENDFFSKLGLSTVSIFSSLDEPLLSRFGGEKIDLLLKKMGMSPTTPIEHIMISKAIKSAQQKISKKIVYEQPANSAADWMTRNYPS